MKTKFHMRKEFKLTSVKLITDEYKAFKQKCIDTGISFHEFANVCIYLYNTDADFGHVIHRTMLSGSI